MSNYNNSTGKQFNFVFIGITIFVFDDVNQLYYSSWHHQYV